MRLKSPSQSVSSGGEEKERKGLACAFVSPSLREAFTPFKRSNLSFKRIFIRADLSRICIRLVAYCLKQPTQLKHFIPIQPCFSSFYFHWHTVLVFSFMNAQLALRLLFYECTIIFPFCSLLFYEYQYLAGNRTGDIYYALYLLPFHGCSYEIDRSYHYFSAVGFTGAVCQSTNIYRTSSRKEPSCWQCLVAASIPLFVVGLLSALCESMHML